MPQISSGQAASLVLDPGQSYTISTTGVATVKGIYGAPSTTTTLNANFAVFGPYGVPAKLDIACTSGVASYALDQYEGDVVRSKTNPLTGGLYLQGSGQNITYPPSTWANMPSAAAVPGVVIRCTDIGNSPAGTMLISDGVYWRPVGGQVHIVERSGSPFYPLTQNTGSVGFNFTLPFAGVIPGNFLIPGESQIEVEVWVKKVGGNGTATLNIFLGLNGSNTSDYRIVQGSFAAADGSELALRPLVSVGNATRLSSATFLTAGSVSPQTNSGTDSGGGMFNSAVSTNLTINIGAANAADTFRLCAYRVTVKQ